MKTKSFLFLAAVTALFANAASAQTSNDSELLVLPTYVVTAPRQTAAEKQISANLQELSAQASADAVIANELPFIKAPALSQTTLAKATKELRKLRVAKS